MAYDPKLYSQSYLAIALEATDLNITSERAITMANNLFAVDAGARGAYTLQVNNQATQTANTTLVASSSAVQFCNATGAGFTLSLPFASSCVNKYFYVKKVDSSGNAVTVGIQGSDVIDGASTYSLASQYNFVLVESDGVGKWFVLGSSSSTGAPVGAQYVTLANDGTLTSERVLTAGKNVFITDAGANSTVTVEVGATSTPSTSTGLTVTSNTNQLVSASGGNVNMTLPAASAGFKTFNFVKTDSSANTVTITRAGSDSINGVNTYVLYVQYHAITLVSDSSTSWYIF